MHEAIKHRRTLVADIANLEIILVIMNCKLNEYLSGFTDVQLLFSMS